ncbi:MAG TPA: VOC family protein [Xanthobacteraceae bacterium]|nr:VOC family protein [Xanthobacteraceae bacterium]
MSTMALHADEMSAVDLDPDVNPDAPLHIRALNHTTLPVHDRYKAAKFYVVVLGAEMHHESDPDRVKQGKARALQVGVRLCSGLELDLFEQNYGQPKWDQSHPHIAFDVTKDSLLRWAEHLKKWGVPFVGPMTRAGSGAAEIYFNDPDGNHLELYCAKFPNSDSLPSGPFDKSAVVHQKPWPAPELEAEANRLLEASLKRMRARKAKKTA